MTLKSLIENTLLALLTLSISGIQGAIFLVIAISWTECSEFLSWTVAFPTGCGMGALYCAGLITSVGSRIQQRGVLSHLP